ncbi:MAG: hypothetical protein CME38_14035 [Haliea sp.]|jgi:DNA topoisomerase-3|nr:hypothetical protein [Haliea sp.]|tara:strand:- start:848 stop:2671 length:1824 start_codon:yes stop_codon:yes gene_type:complete
MSSITTILCEKPSQALAISKVLGLKASDKQATHYFSRSKNICILYAIGHLFELMPPEHYNADLKKGWRLSKLPVFPSSYNDFSIALKPEHKAVFTGIKKRLAQTSLLLVATDPDGEGELIARDIIEQTGYKGKAERILCSSTVTADLKKAFDSPVPMSSTAHLANQADLRRKVDWLFGMNGTMAASSQLHRSNLLPRKKVFNIGRVISALSLIVYDREMQIKNFKAIEHYKIKANLKSGETVFSAYLTLPEPLLDDNGYLTNKSNADKLLDILPKSLSVLDLEKKRKKKSPPLTFCLSDLQIEAGKYGVTPERCLQIVQNLYVQPHSALTYPRTDCRYLPTSMLSDIAKIFTHLNHNIPILADVSVNLNKKPSCFNDEKVTAHHAIIPTTKPVDFERLTDTEKAVYLLASKRFVQQFMDDFTFDESTLLIGDERFSISCKGKQVVNLGWQELSNNDSKDVLLPNLKVGDEVEVLGYELEAKKTQPPKRFAEHDLIAVMGNPANFVRDQKYKEAVKASAGIGTEATRSDVIKRALANGLITTVKNGKSVRPGDLIVRFAPFLTSFSVEHSVLLQARINELASKGDVNEESYRFFTDRVKKQVSKWEQL